MFEVIISETPQAQAAGEEGRTACERAVMETLRLEGRRLAGLLGRRAGAPGGAATTSAADGRAAEPDVEVSVTLTDDAGIRDLNRRYLDRDSATDVLSFSMGEDDGGERARPDEPFLLGDVVVSVDTAKTQATDWDRPYPEELARLMSHGTLHLLGYTDESPEASAAMHAKEDAVLKALGFVPGRP